MKWAFPLRIFWPKWDPCLRIFGEKVTRLGGTSLYALTCEYPPPPRHLTSTSSSPSHVIININHAQLMLYGKHRQGSQMNCVMWTPFTGDESMHESSFTTMADSPHSDEESDYEIGSWRRTSYSSITDSCRWIDNTIEIILIIFNSVINGVFL